MFIVESRKIYVEPYMSRHKILFWKKRKKFRVISVKTGQAWDDPSYGNGGGNFIPVMTEKIIAKFNTKKEADDYASQYTDYIESRTEKQFNKNNLAHE